MTTLALGSFIIKGMVSEMSKQQFATAVLGIITLIAGGFLMHTAAGAPLISIGGTLAGIAIPWPHTKGWTNGDGT